MKMMEFDISGCDTEQVLMTLWNCPETAKSSGPAPNTHSQPLEINAKEAGTIFRGADLERTGIIRLDIVKKPSSTEEQAHPQFGFAPTQIRYGTHVKPHDNAKHLYITLKGRWRTSKLHPKGDQFQGYRLQFRINRQGNSFFKFHEPGVARQLMLTKLQAIEIIDFLTEEDIADFPEYLPILKQANFQAVAFVQHLLEPYFSAEEPTARKIKTNRFLGMRRQNTFYTKPNQVGFSLNTLSLLKSAFLAHLRTTIIKRTENYEFHQRCQSDEDCYNRLTCSYIALGGSEEDLEEDLNNKNYYRTHSDPSPALDDSDDD